MTATNVYKSYIYRVMPAHWSQTKPVYLNGKSFDSSPITVGSMIMLINMPVNNKNF